MRCCRIGVVGHDSLEIRAIIIVLARLRDRDAIESDVTLTEQRVEEIIVHRRLVRNVDILPRIGDQFTPNVEFDIEMYVVIFIGRY